MLITECTSNEGGRWGAIRHTNSSLLSLTPCKLNHIRTEKFSMHSPCICSRLNSIWRWHTTATKENNTKVRKESRRNAGAEEQNKMDRKMKAGCLARNAGKCNIYRGTETVTCIWTRHKLTKNLVLAEVRLFETEPHSMNMKWCRIAKLWIRWGF